MSVMQFIVDMKWTFFAVLTLGVVVVAWRRTTDEKKAIRQVLLTRGMKVSAGGFGLEIPAAEKAETEKAIAAVTASDQSLVPEHPREITEEGESKLEGPSDEEEIQRQRRAATEEIMRSAAAWGWRAAQLGHRRPPAPYIQWINGEPKIIFGLSIYPLSESPFAHLDPDRVPEVAAD
jgi:hypothetical protein